MYIKKNPNFRAFSIYKNADEIHNEYMDFFSDDAFENRREYILSFYGSEKDNLEREYTYLKEEEMDRFVDESAEKISQMMKEEYL
ncbi:hypothetical protein [Clostridium manihotivorum]|nr:hypothetical protein [Clostridium manihotivorum]